MTGVMPIEILQLNSVLFVTKNMLITYLIVLFITKISLVSNDVSREIDARELGGLTRQLPGYDNTHYIGHQI